jgi:nitroreductase
VADYAGRCRERQLEEGKANQEARTVGRHENAGRPNAGLANYTFFNAPHVALLFMPSIGDNVRAAADVGMYAQTFLLSLAARGLGGVPQTSLGMFADTIRGVLGLPAGLKFLFGISFGYEDTGAKANQLKMPRDPVAASVTFHA